LRVQDSQAFEQVEAKDKSGVRLSAAIGTKYLNYRVPAVRAGRYQGGGRQKKTRENQVSPGGEGPVTLECDFVSLSFSVSKHAVLPVRGEERKKKAAQRGKEDSGYEGVEPQSICGCS